MSDLLAVLAAFQHDPLSPGALGELVLPFRRQFQLYPDQKVILGAISRFWDTFSAVWDAQTTLLCRGDVTVIPSIQTLAILLATLCQGVALNQRAAMYESPSLSVLRSLETISTSVEPHLSRVLAHSSSLVNLEDDAYKSMIRFCCKALTNLSTTDESSIIDPLAARLQSESSDSVIARLLASSDADSLQAVLMFVFNLVHASPARSLALSTSKSGSYIIDRMLVLVQAYFDIDELDEDQVELNAPIFNVSYSIVQQLVELDCFPQAYEHQASPALDFKISSSQLILLKFLDGYLSAPSSSPTPLNLASPELTLFLLSTFVSLSTTLLDETRAKDSRDAAVFQGLVLLLHCLVSIGLASDVGGRSAILPVLETICQLIAASNALTPAPARLSDSPTPTPSAATWIEPLAVGQLKLNCVRLLGILAYESTSAQDRIREAGGLTLLLGLCQINDKNPTLREHSLFAIRNILQNNLTNQALVDGMKPQYLVGERGELRDLPPAMR